LWRARALLTCGTEDPFCRPAGMRALAERIGARAQVRIFDGEDHFFSGARDELARAVANFVAENAP
jgi:surfactin synthase thioesterase subunit